MSEHEPGEAIGTVTHWFGHLSVAGIRLTAPLTVGDRIHIRAIRPISSRPSLPMETELRKGDHAGPGDDVALAVAGHADEHDLIFLEA
jgi:hypothetical protein